MARTGVVSRRRFVLGGAAAVVGAGAGLVSRRPAAASEKLRIGMVYVWLGDIPQYVAREKGFYAARGVDVDLMTFRGGGEVANALVGGSVDVAIGAIDHAIKMEAKGLDVAVVLTIQEKLGFTMFASKAAGIKSVRELKGKVLATSAPGSSADNYMRYLLAQNGLDPLKDVTIVAGGGNDGRVAALKKGSAAAAAVTEPATSLVLSEGFGVVLHPGTEWDYPFNVAIVKQEFLEKNRDRLRAFVQATLEGARHAKANPKEAEEVAVKLFGKGDPEIIRQGTRNYLPTFSETGRVSEKSYKFVTDLLIASKAISEAVPASRLLDESLLPK
jgi:NitT/TauT family transport system substrate-binding protein